MSNLCPIDPESLDATRPADLPTGGIPVETPDIAEIQATSARILAELDKHRHRWSPADDVEPDIDPGYDFDNEGADRLEARDTAQREWRAS